MIALDGSIASIEFIVSARAAVGWKLVEPFFVGPETQAFWCTDYWQLRLGAHVTGYRIDALEWSAAGGWAADSFGSAAPICDLASTRGIEFTPRELTAPRASLPRVLQLARSQKQRPESPTL